MVVGGYSNLSNSCLRILEVLASSRSNGITQKELRSKTSLSVRSVKYALSILKNENLILEELILSDIRNKKYYYGGN